MSLTDNSLTLEDTRFLFVTSANRNAGNNNRFTIYLPSSLISNYNNKQKYLRVSMTDITVPYTWYNVQTNINDTITYFDGTDTTTVKIPEGNYSVYTLLTQLNILLPEYTVTYNVDNNKYTFSTGTPTATINPVNSGKLLGLVDGVEKTGTFTSTLPVNMSIYSMLYLNTDLNSTDTNLDNMSGKGMDNSTILDSIPILAAPFDSIYYEGINPASFNVSVNGSQLSSITLYLTTNTGQELNSLVSPWCCTLQLQIFNKEQD